MYNKICFQCCDFLSLNPLQIRSIRDAGELYLVWFSVAQPGKNIKFTLEEMDIKAFCIAFCEAGFGFSRIMNNIYKGLGMWVSDAIITVNYL